MTPVNRSLRQMIEGNGVTIMALPFFKSRAGAGMRRSTLRSMMQMDSALLSDIGLTRYDIAEALRHDGTAAGRLLDARRSARALEWLR